MGIKIAAGFPIRDISVLLTGFLFGVGFLPLTTAGYSQSCGDTIAGFGCALWQTDVFLGSIIAGLIGIVFAITILFNLLKIEHGLIIALLGITCAFALVLNYPASDLIFKTNGGKIFFSLFTSATFYLSYTLCGRLFRGSNK